MSEARKILVTSALPYANGSIHARQSMHLCLR